MGFTAGLECGDGDIGGSLLGMPRVVRRKEPGLSKVSAPLQIVVAR